MTTERAFLLSLALGALAGAADLAAQPATRTVLRVTVTDPAGAPVPEADVAIVRGLDAVVAHGPTDAAGTRTLVAELPGDGYHVVVRKIGRARVDRFFPTGPDTLSFDVVSPPTPQALGAVQVVARASPKQRAYFIDADAIASSRRPVYDASDIVTRLRPDMVFGLGGRRSGCAPLSYVWVNGQRVRRAPYDGVIVEQRRFARAGAATSPRLGLRGAAAMPYDAHAILASIRAEHVDEMRYHDCDDLSLQLARSESALFVTLKPGIGYQEGVGSYVADPTADDAYARQAPARYRFRVLGVYDAESGAPVEGADVIDPRTGAQIATSSTGTAHLAFLPDGGGTVRVARPGYRSEELRVTISPTDTLPLTVRLTRAR